MTTQGDLPGAEQDALATQAERLNDLAELAQMIREGCDADTMAGFLDCTTTELEQLVLRCLPSSERKTADPITVARLMAQDSDFDLVARLYAADRQPANHNADWDRAQCDQLVQLVAASTNITADLPEIARAMRRNNRSICRQAKNLIPKEYANLTRDLPLRQLWQMLQDDPTYATRYRVQESVLVIEAIDNAIEANDPIDVVIAKTQLTEQAILKRTVRRGHARTTAEAARRYRTLTPPPATARRSPLTAARAALRKLTQRTSE